MIGGNTEATLQTRTVAAKDKFGARSGKWKTLTTLVGFLDYASGMSDFSQDAKMLSSTHVFLCDYVDLGKLDTATTRLVVGDVGNQGGAKQHAEH